MRRRNVDPTPVAFARRRDGTLWLDESPRGRPAWAGISAWIPGGAVLLNPVEYGVDEARVDDDRLRDPTIVVRRRDCRTYVDCEYLRRLSPENRDRIDRRAEIVRRAALRYLRLSSGIMCGPTTNPDNPQEEEVWSSSDRPSS